jgi:hypothetical protein
MTVPVFIRAGAKYFDILFPCPLWVIELVGRVEVFFSGYVKHLLSFLSANIIGFAHIGYRGV